MDDKLYLVDIAHLESANEDFCAFLTDFMQHHAVGIVTDSPSAELPPDWLRYSRYAFCSDGHELYVNNRLRYKNILTYTREVSAWVRSTELPVTYYNHKLHIACDPYTSASLVRNFNELFSEFRANNCSGGFCISDSSNPRRHIDALISSNYSIIFVTTIAMLGGSSFDLAVAASKRGTVHAADNYKDLQQLLTALV